MSSHTTFTLPRALALGTVTLLLTLVASPSIAIEDRPSSDPVATADEALLEDATWYAGEFSVPVAEAARRLTLQLEVGRLGVAVRETAPDQYAGGWIEHTPEYRLVLRFTGGSDGLDAVYALIAGAPVPVHVVTGAPHSLPELLDGLERIGPRLSAQYADASSAVVESQGAVVLSNPGPLRAADLAKMETLAGVPVRAEVTAAAERPGHTYGGKRAENEDAQLQCTTGFTGRNTVTGVTGVVTAGHCIPELWYEESASLTPYPMTYMGQRFDDNQDLQWHTTTHPEYPQFWSGSSLRTVVRPVSRAEMQGHAVCHYGARTGYSCGTVETIYHRPTGDGCPVDPNPCQAVWARVRSTTLKCYGGDSGGPWFNAGDAWGTYSTHVSTGILASDCDFATFVTIGFWAADGFSMQVLTGG